MAVLIEEINLFAIASVRKDTYRISLVITLMLYHSYLWDITLDAAQIKLAVACSTHKIPRRAFYCGIQLAILFPLA
jgi:hypothetical protein